MNGITFDAGGLIALDRKDRRVLALVSRAQELGLRNPARQALISRLIRQPGTDLVHLNGPDATAVGLMLARTHTSDIVDAHVVICAQRAVQPVLTSDPNDIQQLAPELQLVIV